MGAKVWGYKPVVIRIPYDFDVHGGAVGTINLGNLPSNFMILDVKAHIKTALVGGGSFVVGEDGSGDADGYFLDLDGASVDTVVDGHGALVWTAPATANEIGGPAGRLVPDAKDGVQVTIASTVYTAGKIDFLFHGYQVL